LRSGYTVFSERSPEKLPVKPVLVVCHAVVVLIFRKLLERLSEQQLLTIDGDKAQEVRNCPVTHYEFDPSAGMNGKLILRDFNRVYYS
jgi:hypothetical protein